MRRASKNANDLRRIAITLTDDDGIREINRRCFLKDKTTDVITALYEATPAHSAGPSAEIFINVERALRLAKGNMCTARKELTLYIAHGLDHAFGGRDDTPTARHAMLCRERTWMREAERQGLLNFPATERCGRKQTRLDCAQGTS